MVLQVSEKHLSDEILTILESAEVQAELQTFLASKQRGDRQLGILGGRRSFGKHMILVRETVVALPVASA